MKRTNPIRRLACLLLALLLCIGSAFAADLDSMTAETTAMSVNNAFDNGEMLSLLNAEPLHPQSTGYAVLDGEIASLLAQSPDQTAGGRLLYAYLWIQENSTTDFDNYSSTNTKYLNSKAMNPYDCLYDYIGNSGLTRIEGMAIAVPDSILNHFYYIYYQHHGACFDYTTFVTVVARYIGFEAVVHTCRYAMESWYELSGEYYGHSFCQMTLSNGTKLIFDAQRDYRYAQYIKEKSAATFFGIPRDGVHDADFDDQATHSNYAGISFMSFNEAKCNAERDSRWIPTTAQGDVDIRLQGDGDGSISGAGAYYINQVVTLTAAPNGCSAFDGWYDANGTGVSTNAAYSFYCTGDVVYTAQFINKHNYTTKVIAPTCTETGYTEFVCAGCGTAYRGNEQAALGHNYRLTKTTATCTTAGVSTYTCSRCGDSNTESVEFLGHDWTAWSATTASTATEVGTMTRSCKRCSSVENDALPSVNPFVDVASDQYYYVPVLWAVKHQIVNGVSADTFAPAAECTRAQVVTFLWREAGKPEPTTGNNPFADVSPDKYYYQAVLWAVEQGITAGTSKTTFSPNDPCTRAQVVTFQWRAAGEPEPTGRSNPFTDVRSGQYYYKAVLWAVENKITAGTSSSRFSPNATCTRAQIVTFLYRQDANG